jgi:transglutaminase-like putative cysteine protease
VVQAHQAVEIEVHGLYEHSGADQWLRYGDTPTLPPPFWLRNTGMARHDESFDPLIADLGSGAADSTQRVMVLHELMKRVAERIEYRTGVSTVETTAAEALARGAGVAQDTTHVFIAATRRLGVPARYVSGYLRNDDRELRVGATSHSWAEAWVPGLDWVGFDPANAMSPRGDSLRVAVGLDYRDAAPVSGRRIGTGDAKMTVEASVRAVD